MNSCLYECTILHARLTPRPHRFAYRIFLFAIDLAELETLHGRLAVFSLNRPNLYSFRDQDYLPTHEPPHNPSPARSTFHPIGEKSPDLRARVAAYLGARGVESAGGRILLVTLPRVAGYGFNPVSFYFCYDRSGAPVAALAEVTNTFKEMKAYWLGPETRRPAEEDGGQRTEDRRQGTGDRGLSHECAASPNEHSPPSAVRPPSSGAARGATFQLRIPKHFYVSPYSDVDVAFEFRLRTPGGRLDIRIDDYIGEERTLLTTLGGQRRELTTARLLWFSVKYPLITVRVIGLIHWHAFCLWVKRVPWFAKTARAGDQRDLHRPHDSLLQPTDTA